MTTPDFNVEQVVRDWLMNYAWADDSEAEKRAHVDCIMAQGDWRHVDAVADKFAGAQWEQGPEAFADGIGFALSALYECHDGPHTGACPSLAWYMNADIEKQRRDNEIAEGKFRTCRVLVPDSHGEGHKQLGDPFIMTNSEITRWTPMQDDWTLQVMAAGAWINRFVPKAGDME